MRNTLTQWFDSLVNRAVLLVVGVTVLTAVIVTIVSVQVSRQELEVQARAQVKTVASMVALDVDQKLADRFLVLSNVAESLTMEQLTFELRAQLLVERQVALHHLFNDVYLFDHQGVVLSHYPLDAMEIGFDAGQRSYFRQTSLQLTPMVSEPFISFPNAEPTVMMTAPVFDHKGRFIGIIGGSIALESDNFLGRVLTNRLGESGYLGIATRSGITLAHPRADEVMQPLPPANEALQEAVNGYEGTRFTVNSLGRETLVSVQQMNQAPWFVIAVWPLEEALASINRLTRLLLWVSLAAILMLAPLAWWRFRKLLGPLGKLDKQINERHQGLRTMPVDVTGGREIREVAETFNQVMEERGHAMASLVEREAFFRSLSQSAPVGIVQTDVLGRIEFVNPAFEAIIGQCLAQLQRQHLMTGVYEGDRTSVTVAWREALHQGRTYRGQFRISDKLSGRLIWVDTMTSSIQTANKALGTISIVHDITHEREIEEQLKTEQSRAEGILGVLQEGVLLTDNQGQIRYANWAACSFLGVVGDCVGQSLFDLFSVEVEGKSWTINEFLAKEEIESLDAVMRNTRNQVLDVELTMLRLGRDTLNERLVFVLRDDRERRRHEEKLSWEATHDTLTGLLNRRGFNGTLTKWLMEAKNLARPSVLMLIDLDHFKPVNDRGGHLLGDELLRRLAGCLTDAVRQSDFAARLGGDEFGIILPACGLARAEELAEHIRVSVESLRIEKDGVSYGVTASIGLTELSADDSGPRETVARADEGCYAAKARGRNAVVTVPAPLVDTL
ncbi:MAG: diguanylate cyclase [Marinobacter sp.]|uniref:diguanylate cyclase domain-containing protein n=1 Tax=Marinobacter sp. TaxID=50741 RepID=UPI0034A06596